MMPMFRVIVRVHKLPILLQNARAVSLRRGTIVTVEPSGILLCSRSRRSRRLGAFGVVGVLVGSITWVCCRVGLSRSRDLVIAYRRRIVELSLLGRGGRWSSHSVAYSAIVLTIVDVRHIASCCASTRGAALATAKSHSGS
jgi:hypothetical protein